MRNIELPDEIYEQASQLAKMDHVSVDKLVAALVKEGVHGWANVQARAQRGSLEKLRRVLAKVSDTAPAAEDTL